jgi:predicted nucleotidyltransferase
VQLEQEETRRRALTNAVAALNDSRIDNLVVGGVAISYHLDTRIHVDHDVDLLIREPDVERATAVMSNAGFEVVRTHPTWLFKAHVDGATVDVLYRLGRILSLDGEMLERRRDATMEGVELHMIGREDLALGQAGAASTEVPGHWFEAIDLLRSEDVDWRYLAQRGLVAPNLTLALLHHARYVGIDVPQIAFD